MSSGLWNTMFNAVADAIITMFGYFFQLLGAATGALFALIVLAAVMRLVVKPILGYKLDSWNVASNLKRGEMKARFEKRKSGDK